MYTLSSESSALTRIKMKVLITFPMLMDTAIAPDCRTIQHCNTHGDRFTGGRQERIPSLPKEVWRQRILRG